QRFHFTQNDTDLVKKFNLETRGTNFHVVLIQSVNHPKTPEITEAVLGRVIRDFWLIEEDKDDKHLLEVINVSTIDFGGDESKSILDALSIKFPYQQSEKLLEQYSVMLSRETNPVTHCVLKEDQYLS